MSCSGYVTGGKNSSTLCRPALTSPCDESATYGTFSELTNKIRTGLHTYDHGLPIVATYCMVRISLPAKPLQWYFPNLWWKITSCMIPNILSNWNKNLLPKRTLLMKSVTQFVCMTKCINFPGKGDEFSFVNIKLEAYLTLMVSMSNTGSVLSGASLQCEQFWHRQPTSNICNNDNSIFI